MSSTGPRWNENPGVSKREMGENPIRRKHPVFSALKFSRELADPKGRGKALFPERETG